MIAVMSVLRGDIARLERCTAITTGTGEKGQAVKRSKPFKYAYEKEIVMYAYFKVGIPHLSPFAMVFALMMQ